MKKPKRQIAVATLVVSAVTLSICAIQADNPTSGQLGAFTLGPSNTTNCPAGFTCNNFSVACPKIEVDATGVIAFQKPTIPTKGMIMFFSGSAGTDWWPMRSQLVPSFFQTLLDNGYELVQVAWNISWLQAPPNVQAGQKLLACRVATAIKWTHDNWYAPLGLKAETGHCGFCLTGESGGAAAITYALASYGIDGFVDAAVPTSGPPMAALAKGCLQQAGYDYRPEPARLIDLSYGYRSPKTGAGPCELHDPKFTATWIANSVESCGGSYYYPKTRIQIIIGAQDNPIILNHANDYFKVLQAAHQPMLTWQRVPRMGHQLQISPEGLEALFTALTQGEPGSRRKAITR